MDSARWLGAAALVLAAVLAAPVARAETTACVVVPQLPNALVSSIHYCLDQDFVQSFTQTALQVNADGIVLDCNGHAIRNTNASNTAAGIAGYDRKNVIIRNCVVDGFYTGISLGSSSDTTGTGNLIEGNHIRNSRQVGLYAIGSHNRVERNRVTNVDGSYNGVAYGMHVFSMNSTGVGVTIRDNVVSDFRGTFPVTGQSVIGIFFSNLRDVEVVGNTITGLYASTNNSVHAMEAYVERAVVRDNVVIAPTALPAPPRWAAGMGHRHLRQHLRQRVPRQHRRRVRLGHLRLHQERQYRILKACGIMGSRHPRRSPRQHFIRAGGSTMPGTTFRTASAALALAAIVLAPAARAETTACTVIESLPAVLDVPGHYCMEADFTQSLNTTAIVIAADNVVLDCNDHRIRNTLNTNGAAGISLYDRNEVTVRNCVVDGFHSGINLGTTIEGRGAGNRIEGNHVTNSRQMGIHLSGSHNLIVGNRITRVTGNYNGVAYGIFLVNFTSFAVGNVIRDNVIADFKPTPPPDAGSGMNAIYIGNGRQTVIEGNTISGLYPVTGKYIYAIESYGFEHVVRNNTVLAPAPLPPPWDGAQSAGIILFGDFTQESRDGNACEGNTVGGFATNISGCVKSGNIEF